MNKKLTVLFLVLVLCINQLYIPVLASSWQNFTYTEANGEITITKYTGLGVSDVTIPGTIDGKPVMAIADYIFSKGGNPASSNSETSPDNLEIRKIIIPENVRTIGNMFAYCPNLKTIDIPSTLNEIQNLPFKFINNGKLESINVSEKNNAYSSEDGVLFSKDKSILLYYPRSKKDTHYTVPLSVTAITSHSIACNNLKTIDIHENVYDIQPYSINSSNSLESINVYDENPFFTCSDGILYSKDRSRLILYPSGKSDTEFVIPSNVSIIESAAINSYNLKKITISESVSEILENNFISMQLQTIDVDINNPKFSSENGILFDKEKTKLIKYPSAKDNSVFSIPIGVEKVLKYAFAGAFKLVRVNVPGTVKAMEDMAFAACDRLEAVYFYGDAPAANNPCSSYVGSPFKYYYLKGCNGFGETWCGYPTKAIEGIKYDVISEPKFENVNIFSEGMASVLVDTKDTRLGKLRGYMDTTGKIVIEPQYREAGDFHEGVAYVKDTYSNEAKIIDKTGKVVLDSKDLIPESVSGSVYYSSATYCSEGLIGFNYSIGGCTDFYDINKNFIVGNTEDTAMWLNAFSEEVSCGWFYNIKDNTTKAGFIDKTGKITYTSNNAWFKSPTFNQSLALAGEMDSNGVPKCGFVDKSGSYAIPPKFDDVFVKYGYKAFFDGLAVVAIDSKWGAIDKTGKFVINPIWDEMYFFTDGVAPVKKDNKWGVVNTKGELIVKPVYDSLTTFSNGLALAEKNHKRYWINKNGDYLGEFKEQLDFTVNCIDDGVLFYKKDNLYGAIKIISKVSSQDFNYEESNGEITITKYIGSGASEISIPENIDGKPVTAIADYIFSKSGDVVNKIIIPENVRIVGNIFSDCPNLKSVDIPSTVVEIKNPRMTFLSNDNLESINVSVGNKNYSSEDGVLLNKDKSLLIYYPAGKKDTSYSIPLSVTKIESYSIGNRYLKIFNIHENVIEIPSNAVYNTSSLEAINASISNPFFTSSEGVLYSKDKFKLIAYPANKSGAEFIIPSYVRSIESYAIRSANLKKITVSENVYNISSNNFNSCYKLQIIDVDKNNLKYSSQDGVLFDKDKHTLIKYPEDKNDKVYSIPLGAENVIENAFVSADYLERVNVPGTVKNVGNFAFWACSNLTGVYFYGDAPDVSPLSFNSVNGKSKIYYKEGSEGFTNPWNGFAAETFEDGPFPSPTPTPTLIVQPPVNNPNPISGVPAATSTETPTATPAPTQTPATVTPATSKPTLVSATPTAKPSQVNEPLDKKPAVVAFKDIQNHWAVGQIIELVNKNAISGYEDGTFKPNNIISRAELAVIIVKVLGLKQSEGTTKFKDDKDIPYWSKAYIKTAVEAGILSGYTDNTFKANKSCSREEIVTMIMRAMKLGTSADSTNLKDAVAIQSWAKGYVSKAINLKIIKGYEDGTFKPAKSVTRAEAAVILVNALKQR
ncbi:leucine-rich repeat protein [Pseudobacteroides cellulosolvens]|uniref:S-layer domain-containing protein n=1 Tax=Pseudobacteroides cellulosolvens ATCC 35603 = DSM 2933 TaxID=398512 RepID=A0A0L6JUD5_9FIRM|nr:leucine-rich repeat protein [Pseudobacteroides cellulosolvens]KNY29433.1 S-layer domain-containing protein [Pseudobacteroides cellulosolvens ATCC 35603 = DSM 2933]